LRHTKTDRKNGSDHSLFAAAVAAVLLLTAPLLLSAPLLSPPLLAESLSTALHRAHCHSTGQSSDEVLHVVTDSALLAILHHEALAGIGHTHFRKSSLGLAPAETSLTAGKPAAAHGAAAKHPA
jgi:hypothetical protein